MSNAHSDAGRYGEDMTKHKHQRAEEVKELLQFDQLKRQLALMEEVRQIKNLLTNTVPQTLEDELPEQYLLSVTVKSARQLPRMDLVNGTDAYCVVSVDDHQDEVYQTRVVRNSTNPEWNAKFEWLVPVEAQLITVAVIDHDTLTQDDLVGLHVKLVHQLDPLVAKPAS
jgi:hypothetical protein